MRSTSRRPIGKQAPTAPRVRGKAAPPPVLALPNGRDTPTGTTAVDPDPQIVQAKRDIDAGQVDTDMHATPGLDAQRRASLVPGPGGQPLPHEPAALAPALAEGSSKPSTAKQR